MARPPKNINWNAVIKMMQCGNNAKQIAKEHEIDTDTFYIRFKQEFGIGFQDYSADCHEVGKGNILYTQYMKALSGNTKMLELLGREWCGQGKEQIQKSPFEDFIEMKHENMKLKHENSLLKDQINGNKPETG